MSQKRLWQFLPDRSQLMLLAGVLVVLAAAIGFVNLAVARAAVVSELQAARAQTDQMEEQNQRLKDELARAQQGDNVGPRALDDFNMTRPGAVIVEPEPLITPQPTVRPAGPPYWAEWWKRLAQP